MMALLCEPHAWRLADLLDGLLPDVLPLAGGGAERQVSALTLDSRTALPGALFLAGRGRRVHGLAYAEEATRRGAAAILAESDPDWPARAIALVQARTGVPVLAVPGLAARIGAIADRFYGEPSAGIEVFGVAGRHGKTSIAHLLAQALAPERRCAVLGSVGNGFPGELTPATPDMDALVLQATLAGWRRLGAAAIAMTVSSATLGRYRADGVRFSHAVLADLGGECLECGADRVPERRLLRMPGLRWAVLNLDNPSHPQALAELAPGVRVAGYSLRPDARAPSRCDLLVRALWVSPLPAGLQLQVATDLGEGLLQAPLLGSFNAANLLAVLAVLLSRGTPLREAIRDLERVRGVPGRMERFGGDGAPLVVVDCARTPVALEQALTGLRLHGCRRAIGVLGCRGGLDRDQRPRVGAIAERLCHSLILTDDNPGDESGDAIVAQILAGVARPDAVRVERQRGLAIRRAIAVAGRGDAVLVAGKGHETVQDLGDLQMRFSDRAQVVEALREWREGHH